VKLFLDSSVLISASASSKGASRYIIENVPELGVQLVSSHYCYLETVKNLPKTGPESLVDFGKLVEAKITWISDTVLADKIVIFPKAKDRPVILSALASEADALLTLDRQDFMGLLGSQFYGMQISTPGDWLVNQR